MNEFDKALEDRLRDWATAIGGEQFRRFGSCSSERIHSPAANDDGGPLHEIERHVRRMESLGRWKEARVLRTEYLMAALPEAERLQSLSRLGLTMSRTTYYVYLTAAKTFVAGAVSAFPDALRDKSMPAA